MAREPLTWILLVLFPFHLHKLVAEFIPTLLRRAGAFDPFDLATAPEAVDGGDDFEGEDGAGDEAADHGGGDALDGFGADAVRPEP